MTNSPPRRPRLSYANVAATLALVLATSMGGAYAHGKIGSAQLKANAVKSKHIANGNVKTADLGTSSVTGGKVKNRSLAGVDLHKRATGLALAGVSVNASGAAIQQQFNRLGGPITMTQPTPGRWNLTIPGANFTGMQWNSNPPVFVTGAGYLSHCGLDTVVDTTTVRIFCSDTSGNIINVPMSFVLFKDSSALARGTVAQAKTSATGR